MSLFTVFVCCCISYSFIQVCSLQVRSLLVSFDAKESQNDSFFRSCSILLLFQSALCRKIQFRKSREISPNISGSMEAMSLSISFLSGERLTLPGKIWDSMGRGEICDKGLFWVTTARHN